VADEASSEVSSPLNFAMQLTVRPVAGAGVQTIELATAKDKKIVKAWGS